MTSPDNGIENRNRPYRRKKAAPTAHSIYICLLAGEIFSGSFWNLSPRRTATMTTGRLNSGARSKAEYSIYSTATQLASPGGVSTEFAVRLSQDCNYVNRRRKFFR